MVIIIIIISHKDTHIHTPALGGVQMFNREFIIIFSHFIDRSIHQYSFSHKLAIIYANILTHMNFILYNKIYYNVGDTYTHLFKVGEEG